MVTGTVGGAARLLSVSSPGISRVILDDPRIARLFLGDGLQVAETAA
jgi:hypothetical protein